MHCMCLMNAQILQLICTICVDLASLEYNQFHYAFREISLFSKRSKSRMCPTCHQFPANNIG